MLTWSILKRLDFMAPGIDINLRGQKKYRTYTGMWFALLHVGVILAVAISQLLSYLDKNNPINVTEVYNKNDYPKVSLIDENFIPILVGFSTEVDWIKVDDFSTYFTLFIVKTKWSTGTSGGTGSDVNLAKDIKYFESIPCKNLPIEQKKAFDFAKKDAEYYKAINEYGICPVSTNDFYVDGKSTDPIYETLSYVLKPCTLASGCKSLGELTKTNVQFLTPSSHLNISDYERPYERFLFGDEYFYLNPTIKQLYSSKLSHMSILDYVGLIPKFELKASFYTIGNVVSSSAYRETTVLNCTYEMAKRIDDPACPSYLELTYLSTGQYTVVKRIYQSLSDTLGAIGGTNTISIFILELIYGPINKRRRNKYIIESVYSTMVVPPDAEKKDKKKKSNCSWLSSLSCKKKKLTQEEIQHEKNMKEALERVENSLDVCQLIMDLNILKVISQYMFKERHFGLAQLVGFDICHQRSKAYKKNPENSLPTTYLPKVKYYDFKDTTPKQLEKETLITKEMLHEIHKKSSKPLEEAKLDPNFDEQEYNLDNFYKDHLIHGIERLPEIKVSEFNFLLSYIKRVTFEEVDSNPKSGSYSAARENLPSVTSERNRTDLDTDERFHISPTQSSSKRPSPSMHRIPIPIPMRRGQTPLPQSAQHRQKSSLIKSSVGE